MSKELMDIADIQCCFFGMAQKKWNSSGKECSDIFQKYDILGFIRNCYDSLHLNCYACVLDDAEQIREAVVTNDQAIKYLLKTM